MISSMMIQIELYYYHQKENVRVASRVFKQSLDYKLVKFNKIFEIFGANGKCLTRRAKLKILTFALEIYKRVLKISLERSILLSFVKCFTIVCPKLYSKNIFY